MSISKVKIEFISNVLIVVIVITCSLLILPKDSAIMAISYKDEVYYEGNRDSSFVSLMFNVYWGNEYIKPILKILEVHNVKVTFFIGGSWADDNPEILNLIKEARHELGNHGYFHKNQSSLSVNKNYEEINATNVVIEKLTGIRPTLFAPPSGDYGEHTITAAKKLNMRVIMWSLDTIDWRDKNSDIIKSRAIKAKGGELVLMHPTKMTLNALDDILKHYESVGLKVVKVSENIENCV